jgi:hypothetical protein
MPIRTPQIASELRIPLLSKPKRFGKLTMPTVLRFGSMRFQIYVDDHEPPHIHVKLPNGEVVVVLVESTLTVEVRSIGRKIREADVTSIIAVVSEHFETFLQIWSLYHR